MNHDKPFVKNAADESQVKGAEGKGKRKREQELEDIRSVLATRQGRRFFWRTLIMCHVFETSFTGNSQTFFNEGERNIGLKLFADLNESDPEAYLKMLRESKGDANV
jgi:hypothetical protein